MHENVLDITRFVIYSLFWKSLHKMVTLKLGRSLWFKTLHHSKYQFEQLLYHKAVHLISYSHKPRVNIQDSKTYPRLINEFLAFNSIHSKPLEIPTF